MSNNDNLAACLSKIDNAEKMSKKQVTIIGISKMIRQVLEVLKKHDYLGDIVYEENSRGGIIKIELVGNLNKSGAIKPRFNVKVDDIEKFEQRYLPAKGFGILIISTPKGIITNEEAKEKNTGGRLVAYCY